MTGVQTCALPICPETLPHRLNDGSGANGTFAHATAIFGLTLASLVITRLYNSHD